MTLSNLVALIKFLVSTSWLSGDFYQKKRFALRFERVACVILILEKPAPEVDYCRIIHVFGGEKNYYRIKFQHFQFA